MARKKFQRNYIFFHEKDSRFNSRIIHKSVFLIGQVLIKKYGLKILSLLFNIYKIEKFDRNALVMLAYQAINCLKFSTKTYVVGTQKNRHNETVLLSTKL